MIHRYKAPSGKCACNGVILNALKRRRPHNPVKADPSRTAPLAAKFSALLSARFRRLRLAVYKLIVDEDALGLKRQPGPLSVDDLLGNAFCPTGEGGGVDPSCSSSEGGGGGGLARLKARVSGKIPPAIKNAVVKITKTYYMTFVMGNKAVQAVARERGLPQDRVAKLAKAVTAVDLALGGSRAAGAAAAVGLAPLAVPAAFVPWGSVGYLAYSSVRHPLATLRAAKKAIQGAVHKVASGIVRTGVKLLSGVSLNSKADDAARIEQALADHEYSDWYFALLLSACDSTKKLSDAINLANSAYEEQDTDISEEQDDDVEAVFGLLVYNIGRWEAQSTPQKVKSFKEWLKSQVKTMVLGADSEQLWEQYAIAGWKKGAARAFDDTKSPVKSLISASDAEGLKTFQGTKDEFLRAAFNKPVSTEKLKLLASRSFSDLEGVTDQMSTVMVRTLTTGLATGSSPREIGRDLADLVDGLGESRASTLARTEIVRAHAEGQLDAMQDLGVEQVGVQVEWLTAGDDHVCEECAPLEGVVLKIDEATGMLPRHPNCRCAWIPANVGEDTSGQKDTKKQIEVAVKASIRAGEDGAEWGPGASIAKTRPSRNEESTAIATLDAFLINSFCATGIGGGVDPTCSPNGGGGFATAEAATTAFHAAFGSTLKQNKMSDAAFTTTSQHLYDEMSRVSEMKAVKAALNKRSKVNPPKLELNATHIGASTAGKYTSSGGLSSGNIEIGPAEVHANAEPRFGVHVTGNDIASVYRHEFGHEVYEVGLSRGKQKEWNKIGQKYVGTSTVSRYGGTNTSELFAESFSAYTSKNYKRGSLPSDVEKWLDSNVRGG
jgi:SPP1 gp7 family putative phage head morphogenesis protein